MRRFFVKNLLFVIAVNLLVKPLWVFMIDRTVQNRIGHAAYGTYQALFNLGLIFQIILDFGLTYYNTRIISQNPDKLKELFPSMLGARLLLIVVYAVLVSILGWVVGYRGYELLLLAGILLIQAFNSLMQFLRSNVAALHFFKADGVLSVADRLLMIIICGYLLFLSPNSASFSINWFVITQIASYGAAILIAFFVLGRVSGLKLRLSFTAAEVLSIIKQSLPYASLVFLMAVHMRADTILVERLCGNAGKEQAGIYAAGYRLLDVGNMFGLMFAGMLLPLFGRMLSEKSDVQPIIKLCVNIMLPVAFTIVVAAAFNGGNIMMTLYKHATEYDGQVFSWQMAAFPAFCMMYVYSTLLTANGNLKLLNRIALAGVIINLSLNSLLIPQHMALGAAFTAFVTQTTLSVCYIFFSGKRLQLPVNLKWIMAHITFLIFIIAAGYVLHLSSLTWLLQLSILAITAIVSMFIFRFVSVKAIMQLANRNTNS